MAEDAGRSSVDSRAKTGQVGPLYDPHAWEERLSEARIRRAEALARSEKSSPRPLIPPKADSAVDIPHDAAAVTPQYRAEVTPLPSPALAAIRRGPARSAARLPPVGARMTAVFAGGIALGLTLAIVLVGQTPSPTDAEAALASAPPLAEATPRRDPNGPPIVAAAAQTTAATVTAPGPPASAAAPPATEVASVAMPAAPSAAGGRAAPIFTIPASPQKTPIAAPPPESTAASVTPSAAPVPPGRPSSPSVDPEPTLPAAREPAREPAASTAPNVSADAVAPPPAPSSGTPPTARVVVHAPAGEALDRAAAVVAALEAQGYDVAGPQAVHFTVSRSNARYFHAEDAGAGAAVATLATVGPDQPADARDFTHIMPRPDPGAIELWIAGEPPASARATTAARRSAPDPQRRLDAGVARAVNEGRRLGSRLGRAVNDLDKRIQRGLGSIAP